MLVWTKLAFVMYLDLGRIFIDYMRFDPQEIKQMKQHNIGWVVIMHLSHLIYCIKSLDALVESQSPAFEEHLQNTRQGVEMAAPDMYYNLATTLEPLGATRGESAGNHSSHLCCQ